MERETRKGKEGGRGAVLQVIGRSQEAGILRSIAGGLKGSIATFGKRREVVGARGGKHEQTQIARRVEQTEAGGSNQTAASERRAAT